MISWYWLPLVLSIGIFLGMWLHAVLSHGTAVNDPPRTVLSKDRRNKERRQTGERRVSRQPWPGPERRVNADRRRAEDRRSGIDRRDLRIISH